MESFDANTLLMVAVFIVGYACITIEHVIKIDKATTALLTGVLLWTINAMGGHSTCSATAECLSHHVSSISQIIFFLLGALLIVEMISIHKGFAVIADVLRIGSKRKLLWVLSIITFFLSSILDNLTTTIVMVTLLRKLVDEGNDRLLMGGAVVIAANAGGAWTPIGDVTTTMLWIGGQLSTVATMKDLFLPSIVSLGVGVFFLSFLIKGNFKPNIIDAADKRKEPNGMLVLILGIFVLIMVPVFKLVTGLPPFMGVLLGLGILWLVTDVLHHKYHERNHLRMVNVIPKIDFSGLLFFLGILLAISALDASGILHQMAHWFDRHIANTTAIATMIGLASAVVDNVPLVAASMGMYSLEQYPTDHHFWQLIAYCAGTGGSILIIGSAAGVVFMGLEKTDFFWYLKRISLPALAGYFAGIIVYIFM